IAHKALVCVAILTAQQMGKCSFHLSVKNHYILLGPLTTGTLLPEGKYLRIAFPFMSAYFHSSFHAFFQPDSCSWLRGLPTRFLIDAPYPVTTQGAFASF